MTRAAIITTVSIVLWLAVTASGETIAITHVTVIDATGAPPKSDMTVLIAANRIAHVGTSSETHFSKETREVNASGKFLIPGLWDMHVHLLSKEFLPLFTANGITGVRVMSGKLEYLEWRKDIEAGTLVGPRMYIASPLVDGRQSPRGGSIVVQNEAEAREAVQKIKRDGYDFVKVYSSLSREAYFAIEDEAKRLKMRFVGHVPDSITAWEASEAGQRSIEHLEGIAEYCSDYEDRRQAKSNPQGYNADKCALLFDEFEKNHTWQCPTLSVLQNNVRLTAPNQDLKNDPRLKFMPPGLVSFWMMAATQRNNAAPDAAVIGKGYYQLRKKIAGDEERAGLDILAGTDTPNPFVYPGFSLHDELSLLVEAGLTPMQALQAATKNATRFMGTDYDLGTVEAGKIADLVLLDASPIEDISNTRKIEAVVQNGKLVPKTELDKMLEEVAATAHAGTPSDAPR